MNKVIKNINKELSDNITKKIGININSMSNKKAGKKAIVSGGKTNTVVSKGKPDGVLSKGKPILKTNIVVSKGKTEAKKLAIKEGVKKPSILKPIKEPSSIIQKKDPSSPILEKKENISPVLEKNINVPPDKLGNVKEYISSYLDNNFIGKIDKNNGYISSVNIITIKKHIISRVTSDIIYRVTFSIDNNKPEVDKEYTVPVNAITDTYILCKKDLIYFFVCKDELDKLEYKHNRVGNTYNKIIVKEGKKVKRKIYIDKEITLKIKTFQLNKDENGQNYICICTII